MGELLKNLISLFPFKPKPCSQAMKWPYTDSKYVLPLPTSSSNLISEQCHMAVIEFHLHHKHITAYHLDSEKFCYALDETQFMKLVTPFFLPNDQGARLLKTLAETIPTKQTLLVLLMWCFARSLAWLLIASF